MSSAIDLDAYLERIRFGAPIKHDLATLSGLLRAHMSRIPFENLDVLLGRGIRIDLLSIQAKLVGACRGGYCFEHATLLAAALEQLGFRLRRHCARVVVYLPREAAARTHMFLSVELDEGRFVCDPGFGSLAPRTPVPLIDGERTRIDGEVHWMSQEGDGWALNAASAAPVTPVWVTAMADEYLPDYLMGNHFVSTFPDSPFVNRIMMRASTDTGRITLMNRELTVWTGNQPAHSQLADRKALRRLLIEHFGFDLPEVETLRVPMIPEWD